jgi:hypothetical protein
VLKLSFQIFHRARPQATIAATLYIWEGWSHGPWIFDLSLGVHNLEADPVYQ